MIINRGDQFDPKPPMQNRVKRAFSNTSNLIQVIEPKEVYDVGSSIPHTTHCLANGDIMISCMGDGPEQNGRGSFILIDGKEFKVKGTYSKTEKDVAPFG